MNNNQNDPANRIARFIVNNPDQAVPASYNTGLGDKLADSYASWNARLHKGQVIAQMIDGSTVVHRDFSTKNAGKSV